MKKRGQNKRSGQTGDTTTTEIGKERGQMEEHMKRGRTQTREKVLE